VGSVPTYLADGRKAPHKALIRTDTGAILGACGPAYTPLQAQSLLDALDPLVQAGLATHESGGGLREGARAWLQVKLQGVEAEIVPGDTVRAYVLATNAHDGSQGARIGDVYTRVVCANTLASASGEGTLLSAKHTKGVLAKYEDLAASVRGRVERFHAQAQVYRDLAAFQADQATFREYIARVFEPESEKLSDALIGKIEPLFDGAGMGADLDGVRGTMWGAYNAVSEHLQHHARGDSAQRLDSIMFGARKATNQKALAVAMQMAA
jgi:phage/plasmid-like protein (TIGR03299 family)